MCPIQRLSQLSREPKSKISLGIRKPLDDVKSTSPRTNRPTIREGNSGPKNQVTVNEGHVIASEAKMANGQTLSPCSKLRCGPTKPVKKQASNKGINIPKAM